jgi:phosphoribosyl 1,2-cyclic phosphate phosphodiesterase
VEIKYLGTAAAEGIPALFCKCETCKKSRKESDRSFRTRSQALINNNILIDFPADSFMHFQKYKIDITDIHTLIVTHSHPDHFYPIDLSYRSSPFAINVNDTINVYGNHDVTSIGQEYFKKSKVLHPDTVAFNYISPFKSFIREGVKITPLLANHKKDEDCYIYLLEQNDIAILYAHDTGFLPKQSLDFLKGKKCSLLSLDCTQGIFSDGNNHMGLPDIDSFITQLKEINAVSDSSKIVLNHFSHNGQLTYNEYLNIVKDKGYIVAFDGMVINI